MMIDREEIGEAPGGWRHDAKLSSGRQIGTVGEDDLRMLAEHLFRDFALIGRQRMIAGSDSWTSVPYVPVQMAGYEMSPLVTFGSQ